MILIMVTLFAVFLFLGMPLAFSVGIAGMVYFLLSEFHPTSTAISTLAGSSQNFPLLAVPFFVLAGHLMNKTGITEKLVNFSNLLVAWITGGLAHVTIVLSAQARVLGPAMLDAKFSKGYAAGTIAVSSLITATIPPSIGLILYGYMGNVSIGRLFIAGIIPGILMTLVLMFTAWHIAKKRGYKPQSTKKPGIISILLAANDSKWALLFPVFLVVTIRFGIFTPSEAGAFAVIYALMVGKLAYKKLSYSDVLAALNKSVSDIGMIMLIIIFSSLAGYAIIFEQLPQNMAQAITTISTQPTIILLLILGFLVLSGMVMESTVIVLLLTPLFVPVIQTAGIDPVHFGILMMTVVTLGSMTPPVGVAMYAVCGILKCPTDQYAIEALPFILAVLALVLFLAFFPGIILFLPNTLM